MVFVPPTRSKRMIASLKKRHGHSWQQSIYMHGRLLWSAYFSTCGTSNASSPHGAKPSTAHVQPPSDKSELTVVAKRRLFIIIAQRLPSTCRGYMCRAEYRKYTCTCCVARRMQPSTRLESVVNKKFYLECTCK